MSTPVYVIASAIHVAPNERTYGREWEWGRRRLDEVGDTSCSGASSSSNYFRCMSISNLLKLTMRYVQLINCQTVALVARGQRKYTWLITGFHSWIPSYCPYFSVS